MNNSLDPQQFERAKIIHSVQNDGFAHLRDFISRDSVQRSLTQLKEHFTISKDNPSIGETPQQVQTNFQKLLVGGVRSDGYQIPHFFRTFYNPTWADDLYEMRKTFEKMILLRNVLMDLPSEFGIKQIEPEGLWTASRIHQYPSGGGFFSLHRDFALLEVANRANIPFFQVILIMTTKGIDYQRGGAFLKINDKRIDIEANTKAGDVLIYDGATEHGVEDIDPHRNLDLGSVNGRVVGLVSLYKVLQSNKLE